MFNFKTFEISDLILLRQWLNADHIKEFWQETEDDEKLRKKFFEEMPKRSVWAFTILHAEEKIGYIQYYDATKVGGGWWESESAGTFGVDLMIGSPEMVGRGFGSKIVNAFVDFVIGKEPSLTSIIIDPDPKNVKAVRAFEKAGFVPELEMVTPGGPALLMRRRKT